VTRWKLLIGLIGLAVVLVVGAVVLWSGQDVQSLITEENLDRIQLKPRGSKPPRHYHG
jgi:hypothetical protein